MRKKHRRKLTRSGLADPVVVAQRAPCQQNLVSRCFLQLRKDTGGVWNALQREPHIRDDVEEEYHREAARPNMRNWMVQIFTMADHKQRRP